MNLSHHIKTQISNIDTMLVFMAESEKPFNRVRVIF